MSIEQTFASALQHHRAGRLQQAQQLYEQILALWPQHGQSLHLLGLIALQNNQFDVAADLIGRAVKLVPDSPEAHANLGAALQGLGRSEEALACLRQSIALKPTYANAYANLGMVLRNLGRLDEAIAAYDRAAELSPDRADVQINLGNAYQAAAQVEKAIACFQRALAINPDAPEAHNNLGNMLQGCKQPDEAMACYRRAVALKPDYADAHANLGVVLHTKKEFEEAIASFRRAIEIDPDYAEAHNNLGNVFEETGKFDQAIACYRRALLARPNYAEAHSNLGNALQHQEKFADAIACYQRALVLKPDLVGVHNNLGNVYQAQGQMEQAIESYKRALALEPNRADTHNSLGNALQAMGRPEESTVFARQAVALQPEFPDAYNNLGNAAKDMGQLDEAIDYYRKAIAIKPDFHQVHSNLVYTLHFRQDYDAQAILREHRIWNQTHAQPLQQHVQPHTNDRSPDRRLKIGYVSPDFRDHCQCFFTDPLLSRHDKRQFEIFCYSGVLLEDAVTKRLRGYADHWHSTVSLSDEKLADAIRADGIDVLVDLTMHMTRSRILAFVYRPAPVQVSWLAYPSTTGVDAIDYRLTDPHLDPPGMYDQDYSEKSLRLPDTFWCYDLSVVGLGDGQGPGVGPLPALQNGFVTFGCLNNFCKVTPRTLSLWAQTMAAVPKSRLILLTPEGSTRQRVLDQLAAGGITADRVEFFLPRPRRIYLETYHRIDLGLDTLPYNGHTTSLDSFWMGVPVVTLVGQTIVGRAGWSQLSNLNLRELAARTDQQYVQIVTDLAADLPRLAQLRASLRQRMRQSPLTDGVRFARNMENAYRQMWRTWCQTR